MIGIPKTMARPMKMAYAMRRNQAKRLRGLSKQFSVTADEVADVCDRHVILSPFEPIVDGPYKPLYEFVTADWSAHGGNLDGNKTAIVDTHTGLKRTFSEHHALIGGLAATLRHDMGLTEGSCVALYSPNHVDYLSCVLACSLTGSMITPINPMFTARELSTTLTQSKSSIVIVHSSKLDIVLETIKDQPQVKHVIVLTDEGESVPEGTVELSAISKHDNNPLYHTVPDVHHKTKDHPLLLPYSSGSTGLPKGVSLTHENIAANLLQLQELEGKDFKPDHVLSSPLPFFHIYGFTVSLLYAAWQGNTLVTSSGKFDLQQYCKTVEDYKVNRAHLVPPILLHLANNPVIDQYDLSSIDTIISAAAPLSSDVEKMVEDRIGCVVKQAWGMSELAPLGTGNKDVGTRSGSVGRIVASTMAKVVDINGNSLGPNTPGELLIKGPQVMAGYLNEEQKTAETVSKSGWLRTGDVAFFDEDEFLYITDRIKELIKVRGYPVAPAELEALLLTHADINDAAVIGIADDASGEVPRAYVVLKEGATQTESDIYNWVKEQVAPYKRLDGGIEFTDMIPKSPSGKILRRILRSRLS